MHTRLSALLLATLLVVACQKETPFSENYDIQFPLPTITGISPETADIESEIRIQGQNLDRVIQVEIGVNKRVIKNEDIVSKSATEVVVRVPRLAEAGLVSVSTNLAKKATGTTIFRPVYAKVVVEEWPSLIYRGQSIKIKGQNMDMVTAVAIGATRVKVEGGAATVAELSLSTEGLALPDEVVLVVEGRNGVENATSPAIPVQNFDPNATYDPVDPIVVWDFEDGTNPFVAMDITPENGLNLGTAHARGDNYLSVKEASIPSAWGTTVGRITTAAPISLSGFHEPHLTFLVNTNGNQGYFQLEMAMNGNRDGGHFTAASSSNPSDNYVFQTNGWEWRSIDLAGFAWEDWFGDGLMDVDPEGTIDEIAFFFKQGNGTNPFEIHIDQVMITDGPLMPMQLLWDFEDSVDPYSGSASSGINAGSVGLAQGDKYLTVSQATSVTSWNWTGAME
ncbi:MAG: hypothetical protein OHK0039_45550 [Bacteroidia bacterium]